jgi:hypothetical protein
MTTWNLHLVGHDNEETIQTLVAGFVVAMEQTGHVLDSATLTTDQGQTDVAVTPPVVAPVEPTPAPEPAIPVVTAVPPEAVPPTPDPDAATDATEDAAEDTPPAL